MRVFVTFYLTLIVRVQMPVYLLTYYIHKEGQKAMNRDEGNS